jgi:hypothetical protein
MKSQEREELIQEVPTHYETLLRERLVRGLFTVITPGWSGGRRRSGPAARARDKWALSASLWVEREVTGKKRVATRTPWKVLNPRELASVAWMRLLITSTEALLNRCGTAARIPAHELMGARPSRSGGPC